MNKLGNRRIMAPAGLLLAAMLATLPAGCATLGDPGPAICRAPDGTMVPLRDPKCPEDVRRAMQPDTPVPVSIDQSMKNDAYNMDHGLIAGDSKYRQ